MTDMSNTTTDGNVSSIVVPGQYITPTYKLENSNNDSSIPVKYIPIGDNNIKYQYPIANHPNKLS